MENEIKPKKKKHFLYNLFNPQGSGKGVQKVPEGPDNISKCFKLLGRNISNMFYLNLLFIFGNFPLLFAFVGFALTDSTTAASSTLFGPVQAAVNFDPSPVTAALFGVHGGQVATSVPTDLTYIFLWLTLLVVFTFGFVNTGIAYIMRAIIRGQNFSLFSDFFGAIKRNLKQAFFMGIVDSLLIAAVIYSMMFYYMYGSQLFLISIIILCFYVIMRYYFYLLLITFDLSIWKIIKNSLIFTFLGFKRNILAFIGGLLMIFAEYLILGVFFPLGIIFPFVLFFSVPTFFAAFAAYPKIKEVMIDPQMPETVPDTVVVKKKSKHHVDDEE